MKQEKLIRKALNWWNQRTKKDKEYLIQKYFGYTNNFDVQDDQIIKLYEYNKK